MLFEVIKKIDIYGFPSSFTIFNNTHYKTYIGGFLTLLTFLSYFLCFWYFGTDFYHRQNPHFLNQRITLSDYPLYTLNRDDLILAFRIEDFDGNFFDTNGLLEMNIIYYNYTNVEGTFEASHIHMETIDCNSINKTKMRLLTNKDLKEMYCVKLNNTQLGGFWDANFLDYISISYKPCINTTDNNNVCLPREEAIKKLSQGLLSFNVYTNTYYSQLSDYSNPLKLNLFNVYTYVDTKIGKNLRLFFRAGNITTDLGILMGIPESYGVFGLDQMILDTFPISPPLERADENSIIAFIEIYFLNNIEVLEVRYIKLQETIANIGGLVSVITILFSFFADVFNKHYRQLEIINTLFDFSELKDEGRLKTLISKQENKSNEKIKNKIFSSTIKSKKITHLNIFNIENIDDLTNKQSKFFRKDNDSRSKGNLYLK
jgi:hypothetical protein